MTPPSAGGILSQQENPEVGDGSIRRVELTLAIAITTIVVWLQFLAARSGGGLWRDETNSMNVATLQPLKEVFNQLQFDSFPVLWLMIIRGLAAIAGPMNDPAFRAFTFCVGIAILGTLWLNARALSRSYPLLSVALFALSPNVIRWGVSLRAYGLGIVLGLLTCALLWRFVEKPTVGRYVAAAVAAIASVQVLYYNAVMVLALGLAAGAVALRHRDLRKFLSIMLIGALAAVSLVPYVFIIRRTKDWNQLVLRPDYTFGFFWSKLGETTNLAGSWALAAWCAAFAVALLIGVRALYRGKSTLSSRHTDALIFASVALAVGAVGNFLFLKALRYETEPWYYFSLLAIVAVCADAIIGIVSRGRIARIARLAIVSCLVAATLVPARRSARTRFSDTDIVASQLNTVTTTGDVVLVAPWHFGISFSRYYHGSAQWMTVPPLGSYGYHRYDIVKQLMTAPDQTTPVRTAIEQSEKALRSGHKVYIAGGLIYPPQGQQPKILPPAPLRGQRYPWAEGAYDEQWMAMVGYFLQQNAAKIEEMPVHVPLVVHPFERLTLSVATGWRSGP